MNKTDIIRKVSKKTNFTLDNSAIAVDAFLETISEAMLNGEKITFQNIFTIEPVERAPRVSRNPQTGEPMKVPAKNSYRFRLAEAIKEAINK